MKRKRCIKLFVHVIIIYVVFQIIQLLFYNKLNQNYKNLVYLSNPVDEAFLPTYNKRKSVMHGLKIDDSLTVFDEESPSLSKPLVLILCDSEDFFDSNKNKNVNATEVKSSWKRQQDQIKTMLGSLLYFSYSSQWRILAITDSISTYHFLTNITKDWPDKLKSKLQFERYETDFKIPYDSILDQWRPCSWTKVFLPEILKDLDSIVYIDTDFIFVGPAEDIWKEFSLMKDNQLLGIGPEPWYEYEINFQSKRSFAGKKGLNSGLLLFNLTKARSILKGGFSEAIVQEYSNTWKPRHDQDVINSYLKKNPEYFYELSPRFNFLPSVCMLNVTCSDCQRKGIVAVHGADASFYSNVDPRWKALYSVMSEATNRLESKPKNLFTKLHSLLEKLQTFNVSGSCLEYTFFNQMILHQLKMRL